MDKTIDFKYHPILLNEADDNELAKNGYAVFPFLEKEAIEKLSNYYFEFQKEDPNHFYSSTHSPDFEFRKKTSNFIKEVISPLAPNFFKDYKLLGGAFVVKPANGKGILQAHQDWNIVNEKQCRSYNLWIPLVDVTIENGAVFVLPGSHSKKHSYRGPGIPSIFKNIENELWEKLTPLPMKAGEALFYDHALLHGSPANKSDKVRVGIVCGVVSKNSEMQLYFQKNNAIEIYNLDEQFFLDKNPMNGPDGLKLIGNVEEPQSILTKEEFEDLFLPPVESKKKSWFEKLFG